MAPFIGPGKKEVIHELRHHRGGALEITLGRYEPQFSIRYSDDRYELLPLALNQSELDKAQQQWITEGYYMPEMNWQFLAPGTPLIRETNLKKFILKLESWLGWADLL